MKRRLSLLFVLALSFPSETASAHLPNVAGFVLQEAGDSWQLDINLPTSGMHHGLGLLHPGEKLSEVTPKVYEAYLLAALQKSITLSSEGEAIALSEPVIEVGSHETRVRFTATVPKNSRNVFAKIDFLADTGGQHNVFRITTPDFRDRLVLSDENEFSGNLVQVEDIVAFQTSRAFTKPGFIAAVAVSAIALCAISVLFVRRRKRQTFETSVLS